LRHRPPDSGFGKMTDPKPWLEVLAHFITAEVLRICKEFWLTQS